MGTVEEYARQPREQRLSRLVGTADERWVGDDGGAAMNSLLDFFLYEMVRAREQELLESARVNRALVTVDPTSIGRILQAVGRSVRRRLTQSQAPPALAGSSHRPCHGRVFCHRVRARKDAA